MSRSSMILLSLLVSGLLAGNLAAAEEVTADIYVSPKGSDAWSGTLAEPDAGDAGNIIRRNYFHHLVAASGAQSGIRADGGQMDTLIAENLIYKCTSQGLILKSNNRAENNIIAYILDGSRQAKGSPVS